MNDTYYDYEGSYITSDHYNTSDSTSSTDTGVYHSKEVMSQIWDAILADEHDTEHISCEITYTHFGEDPRAKQHRRLEERLSKQRKKDLSNQHAQWAKQALKRNKFKNKIIKNTRPKQKVPRYVIL